MDRMCPIHGDLRPNSRRKRRNYQTRLQCAVYHNCLSTMKYEITNGGDINLVDGHGNNALHLVCCRTYFTPPCVDYLLKLKPNINAQNNSLQTPLLIFISNPQMNTSLLLSFLEKGADPNIPDKFGNTSLHYLAKSLDHKTSCFETYAKMLIKFKANLNAQNKKGETPLHFAIRRGAVGFIPILLNYGASVFIKNEQNLTPIDTAYAKRYDDEEVFMEMGKHVIILNHYNVPIKKEILDKIRRTESLLTFDEQCKNEILKLKDIEVGQTNLTLCTILKSSTHAFAKYLRNSKIMKSFQNNITQSSIIFKNRLDQLFKESLARKEAEEHALPILMNILEILPEPCVNHIMTFLGNDDLNKLK